MFNTSLNNALTRANSDLIAGYAMPSTRYVELTLGASGAEYTAPENGWIQFSRYLASGSVSLGQINDGVCNSDKNNSSTKKMCNASLPVLKGQIFFVLYEGSHSDQSNERFRFYYAEGVPSV